MMSVGQTCSECDGHSARAARYCQWCGSELRALEAFETPRIDQTGGCPCCGSAAAEVSWQTAPGQLVCDTDGCPVRTFGPSPAGSPGQGGDA
jgi:hypothetical protein